MRRFGSAAIVFFFTVIGFAFSSDELPEYILESPDVIEIEWKSETLSVEDQNQIDGMHLIGPDGFISLGRYGRVMVQDLTLDECSKAVHFHLSKSFDPKAFEIEVRLSASNSKQYYVSIFSPEFGQQRLIFSYTGSETVVEAIRKLNDESAATLAPGTSDRLVVLRSEKIGKPVQMLEIEFNEAVAEAEKDLPLRPGDTLMLTADFRSDDLRPDAVAESPNLKSLEELLAMVEPALPEHEFAEAEEKIASQAPVFSEAEEKEEEKDEKEENGSSDASLAEFTNLLQTMHAMDKKPKRIARAVFFSAELFTAQQLFFTEGTVSLENGVLGGLVRQLKDEVSISFFFGGEEMTDGFWLILFGEEEAVTELQAVFKEISKSSKKPGEKRGTRKSLYPGQN